MIEEDNTDEMRIIEVDRFDKNEKMYVMRFDDRKESEDYFRLIRTANRLAFGTLVLSDAEDQTVMDNDYKDVLEGFDMMVARLKRRVEPLRPGEDNYSTCFFADELMPFLNNIFDAYVMLSEAFLSLKMEYEDVKDRVDKLFDILGGKEGMEKLLSEFDKSKLSDGEEEL